MKKTAIIYSPKYLEHNPGRGHPESAERLKVIMNNLERNGITRNENCEVVAPEPAQESEILLVHRPDYFKLVKEICNHGGGLLDLGDTVASPKSFEAALYAVGGAEKAVKLVVEGKFENAFAFVRPPGHHALPYAACGFCIFNNIAVAAKLLLQNYGLEKILILDIDAHHGNGTQEIFYDTSKVLYVSLHQDPRGFPGVGFADEVGKDEGIGYTVNVPLPFRTTDEIYLRAFDEIVVPIVEQYSPQFILMSVGFDGHYTDPVASLSLSANVYVYVFRKTLELAKNYCNKRLVAVLEGGYSLNWIGKMASAVVSEMAGLRYHIEDKGPVASERVKKRAEEFLGEVRRTQSVYWRID